MLWIGLRDCGVVEASKWRKNGRGNWRGWGRRADVRYDS